MNPKLKNFMFGKKCPKKGCRGRLNMISISYEECNECGYKVKK